MATTQLHSNENKIAGMTTLKDMREKEILEQRLKRHFHPSFSKKVISWMKPDLALGISAGADATPVMNRILIILFGSLITGILSTLAWHYVEGSKVNEQILVAVFSISWFLFVSFLFLLFGRTRLLHILSFFTLLCLCGYVQDNYTEEKKSNTTGGKLLLATTCTSAVVGMLLLFSFATSRKDEELYELRNEIKKNREMSEHKKLMQDYIKEQLLKERLEMEEELKGKDITVRKKIADAFLEDIRIKSEKGVLFGGSGGQKQQKKQRTVTVDVDENEEKS